MLVLAPQRVGKSGVIADRICDHPGAVLATSTKADLYATTAANRARLGPVHVFNPQRVASLASTLRWDMLGPCRDLTMARRMASWLTGGAKDTGHGNIEWFEAKGEVALAGLLFAAAVTGATIADVFRWVQLDGHQKAIRALAGYGTPEMLAVVRRMLADNRTAGSVRDTIELSLAWAAIPELAQAVTPAPGEEVFDADDFVLTRGTLYMIASGDEDSPVTPLFRALASYVHYQADITGTRTRAGRLDPPLLMALDEVAVICPIDLPAMLADAAGKGILIMPVVHGLSQLEDRWGKPGGATIWATCGTKLLLPWDARLEQEGTGATLMVRLEVKQLREKVAELAATLADALRTRQLKDPAAPYWEGLERGEQAELLTALQHWVDGFLRAQYPGYKLPGCWPAHREALWEFGNLHAEWQRIYADPRGADLAAALWFHERWLPGVLTRLTRSITCDEAGCKLQTRPWYKEPWQ